MSKVLKGVKRLKVKMANVTWEVLARLTFPVLARLTVKKVNRAALLLEVVSSGRWPLLGWCLLAPK